MSQRGAALLAIAALGASCQYDRADRWIEEGPLRVTPVCTPGATRCLGALERCDADGASWSIADDCGKRGLVCSPTLARCARCLPEARACDGQTVAVCSADGETATPVETCDVARAIVCRDGGCRSLCDYARQVKSNVGCEYWAADLDNAKIGMSRNAAAQQFAVVVSNPQPDLAAYVKVEQDDSLPGEPPKVRTIAETTVLPLNLETFKLGPREVDGSPDGEFNTGTGTALTRHAYRVTSQVPIVAYQFNPLENANVFSNDASLLKPVEALTYQPGLMSRAYVVLGWPQTIASTDDPETNFDPQNPIDLRAFLTVIGTREKTRVRVATTTRVIAGGPVAETPRGGVVEATLEPFEVLNLETGGANADFTSSTIEADQPVVVFSGSEASDAPIFPSLSKRACCADHLEQQLDPIRTAGRRFVLAHAPSRTAAVRRAGSTLGVVPEPEYFRIVAVADEGADVTTSLPPPNDRFHLSKQGDLRDLTIFEDAYLSSDRAIMVGDVHAGQDASFVPRGLPGGDPSFVIVPSVEQYRSSYTFLTPDKYIFDFVVVIAPPGATVALDDQLVDAARCEIGHVPGYDIFRCQLGFPDIDLTRATNTIAPGQQNDGVHRVVANTQVGVLVVGWDSYVSYGYAAGTQLEDINVVPK